MMAGFCPNERLRSKVSGDVLMMGDQKLLGIFCAAPLPWDDDAPQENT